MLLLWDDSVRHDAIMRIWMALALGVVGLAIALRMVLARLPTQKDLGSVSEQWMAQHRAGRMDDPQR